VTNIFVSSDGNCWCGRSAWHINGHIHNRLKCRLDHISAVSSNLKPMAVSRFDIFTMRIQMCSSMVVSIYAWSVSE